MAENDINSTPVDIQKTPLECTMFMSKGYFKQEIRFSYLIWNVKDYRNLETDVCYRKKLEVAEWVLTLTKSKKDIRIIITCNRSVDKIVCYVSPNWKDDDRFSTRYEADKIDHNKYLLKIACSTVNNPETNLEPDVLGLYFRYNMRENYWRNPFPIRGVHVAEEKKFTKEMIDLLETERYSDFTIGTPHKDFKVHKFILANRSEVFKEHFQKCSESGECNPMKFDVSPESMNFLILYMYSGKTDFKQLNQDHVSEVLMLANRLRMELLELRCVSYLRLVRNLKAKDIRSRAREKGVRDLSEKAEEFLNYVIEH